jgi:hypothetical protein
MWGYNEDVALALERLKQMDRLERVVLDEAHCVASCDDAGFRPEYRRLGRRIVDLQLPVLCLTASMTRQVVGVLCSDLQLNCRTDIFLRGSAQLHLKNHHLRVLPKASADDMAGLVAAVSRDAERGSGIVYVLRKADAEKVCAALKQNGICADFYHSGRSPQALEDVYSRFQDGELPVIVATEAFGVGIDPECHLSFVHHFQLPHNLSQLQQHLGRARCYGGHPVTCDIFFHEKDRRVAAGILRLPIVPSTPEQHRRSCDLTEVYRVILDPSVCLWRAVVDAAMPIEVQLPNCGSCSGCTAAQAVCADVSEELKTLWNQSFKKKPSVNMESLQLHMETRGEANAQHAGLAPKLIFAGIQSGVLQEDKLTRGAHISVAKGPNFGTLGVGVKISFHVSDEDDVGTVEEVCAATALPESPSEEEEEMSSHETHDDELVLPYECYDAAENETPEWVAKTTGVDVEELVALNRDDYPGLHRRAKLRAGTSLLLPDSVERSVTDKREYTVRDIIGKRGQHGSNNLRYRVLWEPGNSSTWEPLCNLRNCQQLIAKFEQSQPVSESVAATRVEVEDTAQAYVLAVPPPPDALRSTVDAFGPLTRWCAECLISDKLLSWQALQENTEALADLIRTDDPIHLQRVVDRQWNWLPPSGLRHHLELSADCWVGDSGQLAWNLKWPKVTSRKGTTGASGFTRRIYEYYGSSNILTVSFPQADLGKVAARRLRSVALRLGGREWRRPKVRLSSGDDGHALIFFATRKLPCDPDRMQQHLDAVNEGPLLAWHLDPRINPQLTIAKAVSRTALMLSTVVPTLQLRPEQIVEDRLCQEQPLFCERTDGNCAISVDLLRAVRQEFLRRTGKVDDGKAPTPVQLRFGSFKGTWAGDPALPSGTFCFASHQQKYIMPRVKSDEQCRLEVCAFANDSGPARLNMQVIVALEARMKRPQLLIELLGAQLNRYTAALSRPEAADEFCDNIGMYGQQVREKLSAGFAYNHETVQAGLRHAMRRELEKWFDDGHHPKLHITLPCSRRVMLIPDRYQLLEEDEVILKVPSIGNPFVSSIILARSPCYGPGELLHLRAVDPRTLLDQPISDLDAEHRQAAREWYDFQECCVILSVKGGRSVADIMQGGDFDGDTAIAIWDQRFLDGFRPFPPFVYTQPEMHPLGSRTLGECASANDVNQKVWEWWESRLECQGTVGRPTVLAECSKLHTAWSDIAAEDWSSEAGRRAQELSDIAHKAVDKDAAGYTVSIPTQLRKVQQPRYCLGSYEQLVQCTPLPHNIKPADLKRHFELMGFGPIKRLPFVSNDSTRQHQYALVYLDAKDIPQALQRKRFQMRGITVRINPDRTKQTRKVEAEAEAAGTVLSHRDSTSVVGKLWQAVQRWQDTHLIGLGDGTVPGSRQPDPDFACGSLVNTTFDAEVQRQFKYWSRRFAELSEAGGGGGGESGGGMGRIMDGLRKERARYTGAERDQWAASWWRRGEMEHNHRCPFPLTDSHNVHVDVSPIPL